MGKAWFMAPNGKGIMASMEHSLITAAPMEEEWFHEILFSKWQPSWQNAKKMHYKRYNVNQNYFYALQELHYVNKSKVTSSF